MTSRKCADDNHVTGGSIFLADYLHNGLFDFTGLMVNG